MAGTNVVGLLVPQNYRGTTVEPPQKYGIISVEIRNLLKVMEGEMSRKEIQEALVVKQEGNFRENYLELALVVEVIK